ncbi:MAG: hypothetical protein DRP79_08610, partial [Planctomycetota bacterium]
MYKKAAVIALGLVLAMGVLRAEWSYTLPVVSYGPGQDFAIPVYATTEDGIMGFQFQIHFCEDADSLKIVVDSVTLHGNADYVTLFDTLSVGNWMPNFNVTYARSMIFGGAVDFALQGTDPLDNQVLVLIWGRVDAAVVAPDTIELDLDSVVPCPPYEHTDVMFTDMNSQTQIATLYDGAIIVPLYSMTLTFTPPQPQDVTEGSHLTITVDGTSSDPADELVIDVISGLESWMNWTDGNPGYPVTGTLDLDPGYCDDGQYIVVFQLTSNVHGTSITAADTINVVNVNRAPSCAGVVPDDQTVPANNSITTINVSFDDPDIACQPPHTGDALTITYDITPAPATSPTFVDNGDGTATLDWTPTDADVGDYTVTFTATDQGGLTAECTAEIHVCAMTLSATPAPPQNVNEGDHLTITIEGTSTDPADELVLDAVSGLESWMTWTPPGNPGNPVTGTLDLDPGYCDDGQYVVVFQLTSNVHGTSITLSDTINVINVNREPECAGVVPGSGTYSILTPISESVTFTDPDLACQAPHTGDALTLTYYINPTPPNSMPTFTDNGDGTGTFNWTPQSGDDGLYTVGFVATDLGDLADTCEITLDIRSCDVPGYEDYAYRFQIKKMCAYAGQEIDYPVYMYNPEPVEAYEVLLAYDPSCMTLLEVNETQIDGHNSEYFDYNMIPAGVVDVWPAVRIVEIRDKANNVYTPPIPPDTQQEIFTLKFRMNSDWDPNYACDVKFIVNECGDNTMATNNGLKLHTPVYLDVQFPDTLASGDCHFEEYPVDVCTGAVEKDLALVDGFAWANHDTCRTDV